MNVDSPRSSSDDSLDWKTSRSSGESLDEFHRNILQEGALNLNLDEIVPTASMVKQLTMKATKICPLTRTNRSFVWVILTGKTSKFIVFIDELNFRVRKLCHSQHNYLLLLCEHCEITDREEECVCCHEIEQVANKNQEVMETKTKPPV
jgi:hypothetical protein